MAELPKNPREFAYRGDETVTLTGEQFALLQVVAEKAIQECKNVIFAEVNEWIDLKTSQPVENPTQEQIDKREVALFPSLDKTLRNKVTTYSENLPIYAKAGDALFAVHMDNIENNVAIPVSVLQEEALAAQQKGSMSVVAEEAETVQEEGKVIDFVPETSEDSPKAVAVEDDGKTTSIEEALEESDDDTDAVAVKSEE